MMFIIIQIKTVSSWILAFFVQTSQYHEYSLVASYHHPKRSMLCPTHPWNHCPVGPGLRTCLKLQSPSFFSRKIWSLDRQIQGISMGYDSEWLPQKLIPYPPSEGPQTMKPGILGSGVVHIRGISMKSTYPPLQIHGNPQLFSQRAGR